MAVGCCRNNREQTEREEATTRPTVRVDLIAERFIEVTTCAAIRDVGRVLGMSYGEVDRIAKMVPEADFDISFSWNYAAGTVSGPFTISSAGPGGPCTVGTQGTADLAALPPPPSQPTASAFGVRVLSVNPDDGSSRLLFEARTP